MSDAETDAARMQYDINIPGKLEMIVDPIDEMIEELAALTAAWQKNRDRNRPSPILRRSILKACSEVWYNNVFYEERNKAANFDT